MPKYGLVIDVSRCSGCCSCLLAVKDEYVGNDYPGYSAAQPPTGQNWLDVKEVEQGQGSKVKVDYIPIMYRHNRNQKPIPGVPDGAVYVRDDGLTIIDPVKAKGCRQIVEACNDGTVFWNEELQLPQIYTLDAHRLDGGDKYPRCVESCAPQAMHWGDLDDPDSDVSRFIAEHPGEIEDYLPEPGADYVVRYYKLPKPFITGEVAFGSGGAEYTNSAECCDAAECCDGVEHRDAAECCDCVECCDNAKYHNNAECCDGAEITLLREGSIVKQITSDFFGDFEFIGLEKDAKYTVKISYPGYNTCSSDIFTDCAKDMGTIFLTHNQQQKG